MTTFIYACRESAALPASGPGHNLFKHYTDEMPDEPFIGRPAAKELSLALRAGDRVLIAFKEFEPNYAVMVLTDWHERGVETEFTDADVPHGAKTFRELLESGFLLEHIASCLQAAKANWKSEEETDPAICN